MKKIILALLLIGFLAVPLVGLAARPDPADVAAAMAICAREEANVDEAGCMAAHAEVLLIDPEGDGCRWVEGAPVGEQCVYVPVAEIEPAPIVDPLDALDTIINVLFTVLVVVAVIFIILGAFSLLTAQGDDTKISTGRQKILYAVIAVVVALLARGMVDWVRGLF